MHRKAHEKLIENIKQILLSTIGSYNHTHIVMDNLRFAQINSFPQIECGYIPRNSSNKDQIKVTRIADSSKDNE